MNRCQNRWEFTARIVEWVECQEPMIVSLETCCAPAYCAAGFACQEKARKALRHFCGHFCWITFS